MELQKALDLEHFSGISGSNRCRSRPCQIRASNDREAIETWLSEYAHKKSTHRAYKKESERLLMWAIVQQKKPFSALDRQDFEAYFQFLQNPQPQEFWCSSIFKGPLSLSAQKTAIAIIDSLLGYLVQA